MSLAVDHQKHEILESLELQKGKLVTIQLLLSELKFELRKGRKYITVNALREYVNLQQVKKYLQHIGYSKELSPTMRNEKQVVRLDAMVWTLGMLLSFFKVSVIPQYTNDGDHDAH